MDPLTPSAAYRVLARTYRPTRLSELIGQEALVRTLRNAFTSGRIAHAFLLTGIRGVGKTTTARIIARGLNCTGSDGQGGATPEPCGVCASCTAVAAERSLDVIELDAASHTGKGDMLELMEGVMFAPTSSRFKIYILDEVHMLSEKAWNALLKTVEEPPPHAKFIFATTEVRKVPVTVLSRCQRFDLRRVDGETLTAHLLAICEREQVQVEPEALAVIARAAEGSVRDALSLLDQAIALSEGPVSAATVESMLGLGDRLQVLELLATILRGDARQVLDRSAALHALGADPLALVQDLLDLCHQLSRLRVRGTQPATVGLVGEPAKLAATLAREVSLPLLARAWQMLLRGCEEVRVAPDAAAAAEMLLLRLACVSDLPPPNELARLARGELPALAPVAAGPAAAGRIVGATAAAPVLIERVEAQPQLPASTMPGSFAELVAAIGATGEKLLAAFLYEDTRLIRFEPGRIELRLGPNAPANLPSRLGELAGRLTGRRWVVAVGQAEGEPSLAEQAEQRRRRRIAELGADPDFRSLLDAFPGAEIVDVRTASPLATAVPAKETAEP
jgi:DNA polymerase-3 subunit gamma/tau